MANSMMRWDPFREMVTLRDAMDTLFENALIRPFGGAEGSINGGSTGGAFGGYMPLDVVEHEDSFVVRAAIPGVNPEDLDLSVRENVLSIKGEVKSQEQKEGARYHLREHRWGSFQRQVALPSGVDANNIQAECSNGILTVTLPKAEEAKPKRIQIRTNGQKMIEGRAR